MFSTEVAPPGEPPSEDVTRQGTAEISEALLSIGRVMNQARAHATMCRRAGVDLDRSGAALLYKLASEGDDVSITVLAERLSIDAPAVTRKVQQLERDGLLRRERDAHDARAVRIMLTDEGREEVERLLAARLEWLDTLLDTWSVEERYEFSRLLGKFAATVLEVGTGHVGR
jgi:DNA-binding MarR family transcriptional regulator